MASDIGNSAQDVINRQVGDEYDIFLGIMWSRFGTSTEFSDSGTEEEFNIAIERHRSGSKLNICFLFKRSDIPMRILDAKQLSKVENFRDYVSKEGCLYRDFVDEASLGNVVNLILDKFANSYTENMENYGSFVDENLRENQIGLEEVISDIASEVDEDEGLFEVKDKFLEINQGLILNIGEWTSHLVSTGAVAESATEEIRNMSRFGRPDESSFRLAVAKITKSMEAFCEWGENRIQDMEDNIDNHSISSLRLVEMSNIFDESDEDLFEACSANLQMADAIRNANVSFETFVNTLSELPPMSKPFNKARRRLIDLHNRLMTKNDVFINATLRVGEEIKNIIQSRSADLPIQIDQSSGLSDFEAQMKAAREVMARRKQALRELAK